MILNIKIISQEYILEKQDDQIKINFSQMIM